MRSGVRDDAETELPRPNEDLRASIQVSPQGARDRDSMSYWGWLGEMLQIDRRPGTTGGLARATSQVHRPSLRGFSRSDSPHAIPYRRAPVRRALHLSERG